MQRSVVLTSASVLLFLIGLILVYLGFNTGPKMLLPPVISGIGFLIVGWVFFSFRNAPED